MALCVVMISWMWFSTASAGSQLDDALAKAQKEAGTTTTKLVNSIDLDEFASHFGLTLSEDDEILIRIALMSYCNGAIYEHPVGVSTLRATTEEDPYVGNRKTKKFHYSWCSSVADIKESNKVTFSTRDAAATAGYEPCKRCNP